jgi:hypothetical protein
MFFLIGLGVRPTAKRILQDDQLIMALEKYRIIFLHIIISFLVLYFGKNFTTLEPIKIYDISIDPKIAYIVLLNAFLLLISLKFSQMRKSVCINRIKKNVQIVETETEVCELRPEKKKAKLGLTWETFGKGLERLDQLTTEAAGLAPDLFIGINETGTMIASYLCWQGCGHGRKPLGIVRTEGKKPDGKRKIIQFPPAEVIADSSVIALVDSEIKSGKSLEGIVEKIRQHNEKAGIIIIILGGVLKEKLRLNSLSDFGSKIENEHKPDFVAFYIHGRGFEPPGGRG